MTLAASTENVTFILKLQKIILNKVKFYKGPPDKNKPIEMFGQSQYILRVIEFSFLCKTPLDWKLPYFNLNCPLITVQERSQIVEIMLHLIVPSSPSSHALL